MKKARSAICFWENKNNGGGEPGDVPYGVASEDFEKIRLQPLLFLFSNTNKMPFHDGNIEYNISFKRSSEALEIFIEENLGNPKFSLLIKVSEWRRNLGE